MLYADWPEGAFRGSRIVVECDDPALSDAAASMLGDAGHDVMECAGPDALHRCPLPETGRCALVENGDVVINLLGFGDSDRSRVLSHLRSRYPDIPVVVEFSASQRDEQAAADEQAPAGGVVYVVDRPIRRDSLLSQVTAAQSAR
jgi:CheY-like chemotaxis protein